MWILTPNFVIGSGIMVVGIVLTLDRLSMVEARDVFRYWPVMLIVFGASVVAQAFQRQDAALPPGRRPRPVISPGFVLFMLVVGFIASNAIQRIQPRSDARSNASAETVSLFGVMSKAERTSYSTAFRGGDMTSVMGETELDLRGAQVAPGEEIVIDVLTVMGKSVVYVPEDWNVDIRAMPMMGGVRDRRPRRAERDRSVEAERVLPESDGSRPPAAEIRPEPPTVVLRGFIMMGALVIES